ncbi:unnamed protein product, partial [Meganyctiphanes norvegica]
MASSHKFEFLDAEVEALLDQVTSKFDFGLGRCRSQEERKRILSEIEDALDEANKTLVDMDIEVLKAPTQYRTTMSAKLQRYQNELSKHQIRLDQENPVVTGRAALFTPSSSRGINQPNNEFDSRVRQQVLQGTAILDRTGDSIRRSHAIAIETEHVGTEVLGELGTQRETLERTRGRLMDTDAEISRSRRILSSMSRNVLYNKILLVIIIILEFGILAGLVYWKFFSK